MPRGRRRRQDEESGGGGNGSMDVGEVKAPRGCGEREKDIETDRKTADKGRT
ncbi:hypothetical protein ALC60_06184 [Trachymyrmex zeteki]|uniref:Uncharacterized protein n=1 Tax=Mycetomoellerius zeteki TaxID=64791 RepID=A0A151X366_9HYME|nr:hypothetical protein ALC60_06184 [Trachymyrmex zeteki]